MPHSASNSAQVILAPSVSKTKTCYYTQGDTQSMKVKQPSYRSRQVGGQLALTCKAWYSVDRCTQSQHTRTHKNSSTSRNDRNNNSGSSSSRQQ